MKIAIGILNSILDAGRVEAGNMQLEEEEFNSDQFLEDVVDMYYPVGMKKGILILVMLLYLILVMVPS